MRARAIVHLDMDCFYAQVEQRRLGLGPPPWTSKDSAPLAVQQWDSLIAVNYAARALGVTRFMRAPEAAQHCPGLTLVHVETLGGSDGAGGPAGGDPDRRTQKACLRRYRQASEEVFAIFSRYAARCEMASIDEAYLDLTMEASRWLASPEAGRPGGLAALAASATCAPGCEIDPEADALLLAANSIVERIRAEVQAETGFTVSAGIAENKMCAKLGSAKHKPNRQTIVPRHSIRSFMETVPLKDLRGLGGKLGEKVRAATGLESDSACKELMAVPLGELQRLLGEQQGAMVWRLAQGIDTEEVTPNLKRKQYMSFKSFTPWLQHMEDLEPWIVSMAEEVHERLRDDPARIPRSLVLHHRGVLDEGHGRNWLAGRTSELTRTISRSCPFPPGPPTAEGIVATAKKLLRDKIDKIFPCSRLAIGASDFEEVQRGPQITAFFGGQSQAKGAQLAGDQKAPPTADGSKADSGSVDAAAGAAPARPAAGADPPPPAPAPAAAAAARFPQPGEAQVATFHRASRLHFLGTWRERFEQWQRAGATGSGPSSVSEEVLRALREELAAEAAPRDGSEPPVCWAHVDMDCFFASVATRDIPDGTAVPTAVTSGVGPTSEICSANYAARKLGVTTALWTVARGMEVCPSLQIIPVSEELLKGVESTWQQVYQLLVAACKGRAEHVFVRSCDEACVRVEGMQAAPWAAAVRKAVRAQTRCSCSVGLGPSQVVAKLAVKACKPDGLKQVLADEVQSFLADLPTSDLPQVGHTLAAKLKERGLERCSDVRAHSRGQLREWFGARGELVWASAHGEDLPSAGQPAPRRTMSAEINWGVRPADREAAQKILREVAQQLSERLAAGDWTVAHLTLKLKIAVPGWVEPPWKKGGHGHCDDVSRGCPIPRPSRDPAVLFRCGAQLFDALSPDPMRIRGVGLSARLADGTGSKAGGLAKWLCPAAGQGAQPERKNREHSPTEVDETDGSASESVEEAGQQLARRAGAGAPAGDAPAARGEVEAGGAAMASGAQVIDLEDASASGEVAGALPSGETVACPVCQCLHPAATIDQHVNGHFDGGAAPAPSGVAKSRASSGGERQAKRPRRTLLDFAAPARGQEGEADCEVLD